MDEKVFGLTLSYSSTGLLSACCHAWLQGQGQAKITIHQKQIRCSKQKAVGGAGIGCKKVWSMAPLI